MTESNPILDAKIRLMRLRTEFEAAKEREWRDIQARAQVDLDNAVWDAKNEGGMSVYAIAKAYGTTNRNTIYAILERASKHRQLLGLDTPEADTTPTTDPYTTTEADADHWLITETETGHGAHVRKRDRRPVKSVNGGKLALDMLDKNHVAWGYVPTDLKETP